MTNMIPVTYGYVRVSKAVDGSKNLDTQLMLLADHGVRRDLVNSDVDSGRDLQRNGWQELMARVQVGDTIVVAFPDRLSRNFEDGVRIQAELTRRRMASWPSGKPKNDGGCSDWREREAQADEVVSQIGG